MSKSNLSIELQALSLRRGLMQKEVAVDARIPATTASGYFTGTSDVPIAKAAEISETSGDDLFASQLAYNYFGFLKSLDGPIAEICSIAELGIFQQKESAERKQNEPYVSQLLAESKVRKLDGDESQMVQQYGMEYLDEIIVDVAIAIEVFEVAGITLRDAIRMKMPEWKSKKYMRG